MSTNGSEVLAQLARELDAETDLTRALRHIVQAAVTDVDGAEHAGVSLIEHNVITTPVATDDLAERADQVQYSSGQGPCLQAALDGVDMIRTDDLQAESRWPRFTPHAVELGIRSIMSFQLYASGDTIGALNLYATQPRAFTDDSMRMGALLATHAAVALAATRKELNLRVALESRDIIGQAKGILMERFRIGSQEAFQLLVAVSQHSHRKLRDVAEELATTGALEGMQ